MTDHPTPEFHEEGTTEVEADEVVYVVDDDPPAVRPRWYCQEYPPGFDDVDKASRGVSPSSCRSRANALVGPLLGGRVTG